jgi:hypothetical protein
MLSMLSSERPLVSPLFNKRFSITSSGQSKNNKNGTSTLLPNYHAVSIELRPRIDSKSTYLFLKGLVVLAVARETVN